MAKKSWEQRHEARTDKRATHLEKKAGRLETKAARIGDRISDLKKPEGRRAERMGARQEKIAGRAETLRGRADYLRPNAPAVPNVPNEPYQAPSAPPTQTPWQSADDRTQAWNALNQQGGTSGGSGNLQHSMPGTEESLAPYFVGGGRSADAYADWNKTEYDQIEGRTTNRFADMFSKYVDVANREANRQSNQIANSLGSRGALYSSANLGQQADLRQRTAQDIGLAGQNFMTTLEDQRQKAWGAVMGNQGNLASAEWGAREGAAGRAWSDFLRQSDIPPEFNQGQQWASQQPGGGNTVRY
jgi:hypothetical protein